MTNRFNFQLQKYCIDFLLNKNQTITSIKESFPLKISVNNIYNQNDKDIFSENNAVIVLFKSFLQGYVYLQRGIKNVLYCLFEVKHRYNFCYILCKVAILQNILPFFYSIDNLYD